MAPALGPMLDPRELSPELALVDAELRAAALASDWQPHWETGPPARIVPLGPAPQVPRRRLRGALTGLAATVAAAALTFGALELISVLHHSDSPAQSAPTQSAPVQSAPVPAATKSAPVQPPPAQPAPGRELAWAPAPNAHGYRILVRDGSRVLVDTVTSEPRIRLDLPAGTYRWWVWPLAADKSRSPAIVQASLVLGNAP